MISYSKFLKLTKYVDMIVHIHYNSTEIFLLTYNKVVLTINNQEEAVLKEFKDYSGEFVPDIKLADYSHDALAKLVSTYSRLVIALDGFWYLTVMERSGNDEALACDIKTWEVMSKYEIKRVAQALNINGNDVVSLMKAVQVTPWATNMKYKIDIKNRNSAFFTVTQCPTLDALEKEGKGREREICSTVTPGTFRNYASFFSPDIAVKCIKEPPRKHKDDICCQWAFELEE